MNQRFNKEFQRNQPIFVLRSVILDMKEQMLGFRPPEEIERLSNLSFKIINENPKQYYTDVQKVGKGNFGEVYKATRIEDNKVYAMKILKLDQPGNESDRKLIIRAFDRRITEHLGML